MGNFSYLLMNMINAKDYEQNWEMDPNGYFLIRVNSYENNIEVGYCKSSNNPDVMVFGETPESIMYKIIDEGLLTRLDHAAYLGKELMKAYFALKNDLKYVQDAELENINSQSVKPELQF